MRIIISSAGRRVYLVQWFRQALKETGIDGEVVVFDYDPHAATAAAADDYRFVPAFASADYAPALVELVDEMQPDLLISLNDYELTTLSEGLADQLRARGVVTPVLDAASHRIVADKLAMSQALHSVGIATPNTVVLSDVVGVNRLLSSAHHVIVKDRWGSGSSGLQRFTAQEACRWVETQFDNATDAQARTFDQIILQPDLGGQEYGLDIVTGVRGGPVEGVLARRKLSMRHGETSSAMTVDNTPFIGLAAALNAALGIRGSVDVDVMLTIDGAPHVIDINPRFGGGYPFVHVAGADVPHFYLASTLGFTPRTGWDSYRIGHIAAKHEGIIAFDAAEAPATEAAGAHERVLPL